MGQGLRVDRSRRAIASPVLPAHGRAGPHLCWEPPVDIIETDSELLIGIALPGVDSSAVKVTVDSDTVMVTGFRRATLPRGSRVHRLEIPYGRFERRITFPASGLELGQAELADGCLMLKFSKQPFTEERIDV